ncbi:3TM-type holin [Alteromonas sp. ASW11-36]|uniref:3TM-type holin n=1 Tax=Alteromonas arenosi TaxID=3055817 RepID=A0ABT7STD9_9ALTE|nr:3TM-type holin [Alteromonas sp. ASW11-36]MDM7859465.1 3TM-type holin [Alteromonas sp. ASW11-36]
MSWFTDLFSGSAGTIIEKVGNTIDQFHLSGEEKQQFKIELQRLMAARDSEIEQTMRKNLEARERILVAELQQGDTYTKRARPTVVYFGLVMIALNYFVVPLISQITSGTPDPFPLPGEFWAAWGGIVATWAIGRSFEKRGVQNQMTRAVTGERQRSSLLDDSTPMG